MFCIRRQGLKAVVTAHVPDDIGRQHVANPRKWPEKEFKTVVVVMPSVLCSIGETFFCEHL